MMTYQHYNKHEFLKQFYYSDWFTQLRKDYTYLFSDKIDIRVPYAGNHNTVRNQIDTSSIFLFSVCYYLGFLIEKNPQVIADVGCGENIFKKYLPNIIGFDKSISADIQEWFDDDFVSKHTDEFDCAFAVNSLHYISLVDVRTRINNFGKIIKKGGRGFATLNLKRLLEYTEPHEYYKLFDLTKKLTLEDYKNYLTKELTQIDYQVLVLDLVFDNNTIDIDDWFNGNIRIVFEV